jgi:hypothetical protein
MDFLTSTILAGIAWDGIKYAGVLTVDYLKGKLTKWIVSDEELQKIVNKVNSIPEPYKKNEKYLELAIEEDNELIGILGDLRSSNETHINIEESSFQNSTVNNMGSGATVTNNNNYYTSAKEIDSPKTRAQVRQELHSLLAENAAVFKMYGPTNENTADLMTRKHEAWRAMALNLIVPNNDKIIELLQENINLLSFEEKNIFFKFKLHAKGFKDNQSRKERIAEYPQFPSEINDILGG